MKLLFVFFVDMLINLNNTTMKIKLHTITKTTLLLVFIFSISFSYAQTELSREEISINKSKERLEVKRKKLVDLKRQIDLADSLFNAGEKLSDDSKINKKQAKEEIKVIEKKYKVDSKPFNKTMNGKDRKAATEARAGLRAVTSIYKADLKTAQNKLKDADKGLRTSDSMILKADRKLDMLSGKLKLAEKDYQKAEEDYQEKTGSE